MRDGILTCEDVSLAEIAAAAGTPVYVYSKKEILDRADKNLYVYLYADWNEACSTFRKSASRKDYLKLFQNNEIVMVEYVFLSRVYGANFKKLPVFLKVHPDGSLGPEAVRPVGNPNDHPRRAYSKLKKFLESNSTIASAAGS